MLGQRLLRRIRRCVAGVNRDDDQTNGRAVDYLRPLNNKVRSVEVVLPKPSIPLRFN
jgi:hypothetical protein